MSRPGQDAQGKGTVLPSGRRRLRAGASPSVPRETPGSPSGTRDGNGVAAVRTRQEHWHRARTRGVLPSFLRDELVKFIESAKLGGKRVNSLHRASPDPSILRFCGSVRSRLTAGLKVIAARTRHT